MKDNFTEDIFDEFINSLNKKQHLFFLKYQEEMSKAIKESRQATIKKVIEEIEKLNESFRKDNIPQRLSGDEFNDKWEEELKAKLEEMK